MMPRTTMTAVLALAAASCGGIAGWEEVRIADLVEEVEVTGTLRAATSEFLTTPTLPEVWQFKIAHLAPEGEVIRAGEPVIRFDTSELEQQLLQARAEAASAATELQRHLAQEAISREDDWLRLEEARARLRRASLKMEQPEDVIGLHALYQARLDLELAEAEVRFLESRFHSSRDAAQARRLDLEGVASQAAAQVARLEEVISRMTVVAPREGTVILVTNWRDEKKKVGDTAWRAERIVELPDLREMRARIEVRETDAGRVAQGQRVRLRLDAHPDREFLGSLTSPVRAVEQVSWRLPLKVVRLEVNLDETDSERMRPGMRVRGVIEVGRIEQVPTLPITAVQSSPHGPVVSRRSWRGTRQVPVELGARNARLVEIRSGLRPGDRVAAQPEPVGAAS